MAQQGGGDSSDFFFMIIAAALLAIYFFIQSHFEYLAVVWKTTRIVEVGLFAWIPDWVPFFGDMEFDKALKFLLNTPSAELLRSTVYEFDRHYVPWISWLPAFVLIYFGLKRLNADANKAIRHDIESLLKNRFHIYKHLEGLDKVSPEKLDDSTYYPSEPETGKYAVSLNPENFAVMVPPLGLEHYANKELYNKPIWNEEGTTESEIFDDDLAERSFKSQLGRPFGSISDLKNYERRIYDLFTSKTAITKAQGIPILEKFVEGVFFDDKRKMLILNTLTEKEELLMKVLDQHFEVKIKKSKISKEAMFEREINNVSLSKIMRTKTVEKALTNIITERNMFNHTFVRTGLMTLLANARNSGVLITDEFKWLKGVDRTLWYCLSTIGRRVSFVEVAGCFAHWQMEEYIGKPVAQPEVTEAVLSLKEYLGVIPKDDEFGFKEEPDIY